MPPSKNKNVQTVKPVPTLNQLANLNILVGDKETEKVPYTSCRPTVITACAQYFGVNISPETVIRTAIQNGSYLPDDHANVFTSPMNLTKIAKNTLNPHGIQPWDGHFSQDMEKQAGSFLHRQIAGGNLVVVDVTISLAKDGDTAAHFVIVTALNVEGTITVMDPYNEGLGGAVRTVFWADFYWSWFNNSDGDVGGHGYFLVLGNN